MFLLTKDYKYYFSTSYDTDEEIESKEKRQTCFEVDELISPIIQTLNQKGYKTKYSCSGHYFKNNLEDTIFDFGEYDIECSNLIFTDTKNREMDEGWSCPYIMFDKDIDLPNLDTLPRKWFIEYMPESIEERLKLCDENGIISDFNLLKNKPNGKYLISLYYDISDIVQKSRINNEDIDIYKFYIKIINIMKKLYTWVKLLPDNKKKDE